MGRVVSPYELKGLNSVDANLKARVAREESGLDENVFNKNLTDLLLLVPGLESRFSALHPKIVGRLVRDLDGVAQRMLLLRDWLPSADLGVILNRRPALLLEEEFALVPPALDGLRRHYDDEVVAQMVERVPELLLEDVGQVLRELSRIVQSEADAENMLKRDPSIIFTVQRGVGKLGPPAEVCAEGWW